MAKRPARSITEQCRWCGQVVEATKGRSALLVRADHEIKCEENPDHPVKAKVSKAWKPQPWTSLEAGAATKPAETHIVYEGGPYHGRKQRFEAVLVDGTTVAVKPLPILPGPQQADSKDRACSRYMGHYQLEVVNNCGIYKWVDTVMPVKRAPQEQTLQQLWPELCSPTQPQGEQECT